MTQATGPGAEARAGPAWLTRGVASVSLASLFSDTGHEITTSMLPTFVISVLGSSVGVLGLIEGVSDGLLGVAQLITGPFANDRRIRRDLARGGYLATAVATGALGLAATVWQAGILRAAGWIGRGARSPARDALLASLTSPDSYGRAYGLERAGDNLGAVAGPLLAALLVSAVGIRDTLYLAAVPGAFAAIAITAAARETRAAAPELAETLPGSGAFAPDPASTASQGPPDPPDRQRRSLELRAVLDAGLARPALAIGLFECGNCATTLLILRATELLHHGGRSVVAATTLAVLLYAANNLLGSLTALLSGHWIDRQGPRLAFGAGALLLAGSYLLFARDSHAWPALLAAFVLSGAAIGLAEPAESAYVATRLPDRLRGSGFGLLGGLQAAGDLAASGILGLIWWLAGAQTAFLYAAGWMLASLLASALPVNNRRASVSAS